MPNNNSGPSTFQSSSPEMTQLPSMLLRGLSSPSALRMNQIYNPSPRTPVALPLLRPRARGIQSAPNTRIEKTRKTRRSLPGSFPEPVPSRSPSPSRSSSDEPEPEDERPIFGRVSVAPSHVDDRIRKRVRDPLTLKQVLGETKRYVYIYEAASEPGVFKIGSTDRTVTERMEEIEQTCGRRLIEHYRSELLPFAQCAEKLCHEMLSFYRRRYPCSKCTNSITELAVRHEEWFEVPLEVARDCANLWTTFLRERPYDTDGKLSLCRRERLGNTEGCDGSERHRDHRIRHQRWHTFVSASYIARATHRLARMIKECRGIDFWRNWFKFLFSFSPFIYPLYGRMGDMAPWLQLIVSLGYFLPAQLIQDTKKKAARTGYF